MNHPYDSLTPDCVVDCIESIGFVCDLRLLALNSYENRVYQVGIEGAQPIVMKFYRHGRWTDAQILEEHSFAQELVDHEISVVAPMRINDKTLHHAHGQRFSVFERRGGYPPELDNLDHLYRLGQTLGRIHRIGRAKPFLHRRDISSKRMATESRIFLEEQAVPRELINAYSTLAKDCEQTAASLLSTMTKRDMQRVHGDCHTGNILWRDDTPHFVDLDDCVSGPAIQDIWMFLSGDRFQQERQLSEFVSGYEEFHEFDPRQLAWIEALRTLRIMHHAFWLASRWDDPAFPKAFPWFGQARFWSDHILELREQLGVMQEPTLKLL
jgi:Ser/Thr protein kinase RdoA (MazF antagonist)